MPPKSVKQYSLPLFLQAVLVGWSVLYIVSLNDGIFIKVAGFFCIYCLRFMEANCVILDPVGVKTFITRRGSYQQYLLSLSTQLYEDK